MEKIKEYLFKNFEQGFVLLILVSVASINYWIPYKLAFLNFYYIPILLSAYYLDVRRALLGAVLCLIMVGVYFYLRPASFACGESNLDIALNIGTWAGFLILSAAIVGKLHWRLQTEMRQVKDLNGDMSAAQARLETAGRELKEYSQNLERKVNERTQTLEHSRHTIEALKNKVEEALFSSMDPEVAKLIIEKRLRNEKRKLSIMFCDLAGFTSYSEEHQPEVVIGDLNNFLGEMEGIVMNYRGHIDKYTGDGLMAEFGAPIDYERHALLSVVAGVKMQERALKVGFPWKMRLGIATGDPIVGLVGKKRQMYTAIGDTVNLAARIEELSSPSRVTIDGETYQEVRTFIDATKKNFFPFGDFSDPEDSKTLNAYLGELEANPGNAAVLKKAGFLLMQLKDVAGAHEYLKRAVELGPEDNEAKLAYADLSIRMEKMGIVAVRGRKKLLSLYEVSGIRNPLKMSARIRPEVLRDFLKRVQGIVEYPEDLILPVECLDGSVGISRVVGFLSYVIADMLGLPEQEKKDILTAAYLADIGKTIVPHHLLNRAGSLDGNEFEEVKKHCEEGVRVLRKMGYQTPAVFSIIASHHEYFNGSGYPRGLVGEAIPLASRIVAVAEEYASYITWRPYRDAWNHRAAFMQIEKEARKGKFDPGVVACLEKILDLEPAAALC